jgi:hypothetical protein
MILIATFFHDDAHAFWSRAEPFLILIGVLTVIAALMQAEAAAAITIGILAGLAVDFKLDELYMRRQPRWLYSEQENRGRTGSVLPHYCPSERRRCYSTIFLSSGGEGSMVEGYISVVLMTANHGLKLSLLIENLLFALLLFAPIVFTLHFRRSAFDAFEFLGRT